jgi:hypothetical protein
METIADDEAGIRRCGLGKLEVDGLLSAHSVGVTDVSVRFSLSTFAHLRAEAVQLIENPIEFELVAGWVARSSGLGAAEAGRKRGWQAERPANRPASGAPTPRGCW